MIYSCRKEDSLLNIILEIRSGASRNAIKKIIQNKSITVNGKIVNNPNKIIQTKDQIEILKTKKETIHPPQFKILFEDEHIIIIHKEPGLLTIATVSEKNKTLHKKVNDYLFQKDERAFVVHRLDKDAEGVILFAKTREIQTD